MKNSIKYKISIQNQNNVFLFDKVLKLNTIKIQIKVIT